MQKVHFWLNIFKKLDLFRFEKQMGRAGIYHTYNFLLQTMLDDIIKNTEVPFTVIGPILMAS